MATPTVPISWTIKGLRDLQGRFASMADGRLVEFQALRAKELAMSVQATYRQQAPHGETGQLQASISARMQVTGAGFLIEVTTSKPDIAKWTDEGTGIYGPRGQRIEAKNGGVLAFRWPGAPIKSSHPDGIFFFRSVAGIRGRHWMEQAARIVAPEMTVMGNRLGVQVVAGLAG